MHCLDDISRIYLREGPVARTAIFAFFVAAVIYGGGKGDGGDGGGGGDPPLRGGSASGDPQELSAFTDAEQALGFVCVTNPAAIAGLCRSAGVPPTDALAAFGTTSNATAKASWLATGVFDDYFTVTHPTNAPVRIGTNDVRRLMVFSHGRIKAVLENGDAAYLEPFHAPMSFIAESKWADCGVTSRCWTASSPTSTIVAWENALLNRDTAQPLLFQVEFLQNGNFIYRYGDTDAIDSLTNATFSIGPLFASSPPCGTSSITGTISRASSLYFADISVYGDGTGDTDDDGLTDYDELMILGTDPLVADTDGDGLGDGAEIALGTDPFDYDTDGDGLADSVDPTPLVSCGAAFGQSSAWIAATFTNSSEIISMGYDNYLMSQTSGEDGERLYVFYVELDGVGQRRSGDGHGPAEVLISVGGQRVVANTSGTYGFLLNVGPEYQFGVSPPCAANFSASRSDALVSLNGDGMSGTVTLRPVGVAVVPGDQYCYGSGESHEFCTTGTIHAATVSSAPGDIALEAEVVHDGGGSAYCTANSTAVALDSIAVAGAPASGLVVLAGSVVPMSAVCIPGGANLGNAECDWHVGRRTRNGGHEGWVKIGDDIPGSTFSPTMGTGGIYRVKVEMTLCGATRETYYKIASRNDLDPPGSNYQVGGYDHIGVASEQWQIDLRNTALSHLGSTAFARDGDLPSYYGFRSVKKGDWKCNAFVAYCISQLGFPVTSTQTTPWRKYPPVANDWASGGNIAPWIHVPASAALEPGFVIAHPNSGGSGHCGIVDYDGWGIAAGTLNVNRQSVMFLDGSSGLSKWSNDEN